MSDRFALAVSGVLRAEGGYVDDPADPGGETKFGISKAAYPALDIAALTEDDARLIYRRDYWEACRCDLLPAPLDWLVFDAAVNQGVQAAGKMLQGAVGVAVDGKIGPATVAAAKHADAEAPARFMTLRAMRYASSPGWVRYGAGWVKRLFMTMQEALRG